LRDQFLVSDLWLTRIAAESEKNFSNSKGLLSMTKNQGGVQLGSLHCQPHAERLILPTLRRPRAIRCFFHNAVSHQNGRFTIRTVVPGDYKLFAWEEIEPFAYNDPDVLRRYEEVGIPLKVSEAAKLTVEAKMILTGQ